ncbi:MAG: polysaccharide deacetylase family protein [Sphingomicrobium sp.]
MQVKRVIKGGAGLAAVAAVPLVRQTAGVGCILAYHRVADLSFVDPRLDDWNVAPAMFDRQIAAIKRCADIVPLTEILSRCQADPAPDRPAVALTFDDGYANFYTQVLPILKRHDVPATVFVVTSLIGSKDPAPFDAWSLKNRTRTNPDAWRPLTWGELERCLESGLVQVGGHSHRHLKAFSCLPDQLVEEAELCRAILGSRLGDAPAYAYPYGATRLGFVPAAYVRAVEAAGYRLAATYDLGRVTATTDPYRMPRVEAHGLDGPAVIRAKVLGSLAPYRLTDRLRRAERAA